MNFLIIYGAENSAQKDSLADFLAENKISSSAFLLSENSPVLLDAVPSKLDGITHCAILDKNSLGKNFSFTLGFALGQGICVYALKTGAIKNSEGFKNLCRFDSFEEFDSFIRENIGKIVAEDVRRRAWKKLFDSGNPFTPDSLAIHVEKDNREIVRTYIDAGMSLNERTSLGTPMLNVAIRAEQVDEVKWILEHEIDLDAVSKDRGYSALMDCVWKKNLELAKILVEKGVNLDFTSTDGQSALVLAVGEGNAKMVELLAQAGANPDNADALGMSAYAYAKLFKRDDLVQILEKYRHEK